jgi:hypothetical protein
MVMLARAVCAGADFLLGAQPSVKIFSISVGSTDNTSARGKHGYATTGQR